MMNATMQNINAKLSPMSSRGVAPAPHARLQGFKGCNVLRTSLSPSGQLRSRRPHLRDIGPCRAVVATGSPPAVANPNMEAMAALESKYYSMMAKKLAAPGENLQLFTPYRPLTVEKDDPTGDKVLATLMDGRPEKALVVTSDPKPAAAGPTLAPSLTPEGPVEDEHLTAGYYAVYGSMMGHLTIPKGAEKWKDILRDEVDTDTNLSEFKKFNAWWQAENKANGKQLLSSALLKSFTKSPDYGGSQGRQVVAEYAKNERNMLCNAQDSYETFDGGDVDYTRYYNISYKTVMDRALKAGGFTITDTFTGTKTDNSRTWAEGNVRGSSGFFYAQTDPRFNKATEAILKSTIEISVTVDHLTTVMVNQSQGSWFYLPLILEARKLERKAMFDEEKWYDEYFRNTGNTVGSLVYGTAELILAAGITTTLKITTDSNSKIDEAIEASAKTGYWPFFKAASSGGSTKVIKDDSSKSLIITQTAGEKDQVYCIGRKVYNVFDL